MAVEKHSNSNKLENLSLKKKLSEKRIKEILNLAEDFEYDTKGSIDEDLYGV